MKKLLKILGINTYIAVKKQFNECAGANKFYSSIPERLKHQKEKDYANFLRHELFYHFKEFAQYQ